MERISKIQREALASAVSGKRVQICVETYFNLISAGLALPGADAAYSGYSLAESDLTEAGKAIGEAEWVKREAARIEKNKNARSKSAVMRSLGLKRSRSGAWE